MSNKKIYLVGTPIGNLKDITFRALEILQTVDYIAAEDSRTSQKLLNHFGIKKKILPYHKFNEQQAANKIIQLALQDYTIALISDAGMPLISDPGYHLVQETRKAGIDLEVIPGPSAFVAAFSLSGFTTPFTFLGFLKDKSTQRLQQIQTLLPGVYIIYVAPHKLLATLTDIDQVFGNQAQISLSKELTKKFEKHFFGTAAKILTTLPESIKGEYTLCLEIKALTEKKVKVNKYAQFSKNKI